MKDENPLVHDGRLELIFRPLVWIVCKLKVQLLELFVLPQDQSILCLTNTQLEGCQAAWQVGQDLLKLHFRKWMLQSKTLQLAAASHNIVQPTG